MENKKWTSKRLGSLCEILLGRTPSRSNSNYWGKGTSWVSISDLKEKYIGDTKEEITVLGAKESRSRLIPKGTLLMSFKLSVGKLAFTKKELYTNEAIAALPIKNPSELNKYFLYYALKNIPLIGGNQAVMGQTLNKTSLTNLKLPYPKSLDDQKRIAQVLTDCEDLIAKRKESIALLDELLKSTFLELFGDPRNNERNWDFDKVIEFADCIVPGRDKPKSFTGDIPWVTTNDLEHLGFTTDSKDKIGLSEEEILKVRARTVPSGSVLMTCVGDLGIVSIASQRMLVNQQLHSFQCKETMNNIFLMFALSFQTSYMYKRASTTTVPYLNKTNCNSIPVIKPPINIQNEFAEIVLKVEETKKLYQNHLAELENLHGRLSQDAFKGELDLSKVVLREEFLEGVESPSIKDNLEAEKESKDSNTFSNTLFDVTEIDTYLENLIKSNFGAESFVFDDIKDLLFQDSKIQDYQDNYDYWKTNFFSLLKKENSQIEQYFDTKEGRIKFKLKDEVNQV